MEISFCLLKKTLCVGVAVFMLKGCTPFIAAPEFNPKTCLKEAPSKVDGLQILHGPRTIPSIAADMQTAYCNGQVLLKLMNENGKRVNTGTVWFKVTCEYTGEVISTEVVKSEIQSPEFLRKVSDMIMDSDFTPWQRHDQDAEFIYPMTFSRWWKKN